MKMGLSMYVNISSNKVLLSLNLISHLSFLLFQLWFLLNVFQSDYELMLSLICSISSQLYSIAYTLSVPTKLTRCYQVSINALISGLMVYEFWIKDYDHLIQTTQVIYSFVCITLDIMLLLSGYTPSEVVQVQPTNEQELKSALIYISDSRD